MEHISGVYSFPDTKIYFNGFKANGTVWVDVTVEIF